MDTGNPIVNQVAQINISGNVTPMNWYKTITRDSGKPYLEAIVILSDIVYWYRPTEIRDETTGAVIGYKKKFQSDLLQRSYQQLSNMFGISKREATNAVVKLEHLGVIKRVFRTVTVNDVTNSNVLFIELIPEKLIELTFETKHEETQETSEDEIGITSKSDRGHFQKGEGSLSKEGRNTNTTTEITTNNYSKKEISKEKKENKKSNKFTPPTVEEVKEYCKEHNYRIDPEMFVAYYESNGWITGKVKMKNWQASVRYWASKNKKGNKQDESETSYNIQEHEEMSQEDIFRALGVDV